MRWFLTAAMIACLLFQASAQFRKGRERATIGGDNLNYVNPPEYTIAGIEVTGLNVLDKNAIISLSGLRIGDRIKIPGDDISGAIRKLWNHGLVGDVQIGVERIEGDDVYLNLYLSERPRLTGFYFTGISKSKGSSIKEDLNLIMGKIVNDAMIRNTELTVRKYFVKKGFLNAEVRVIQEKDTLNRDGLKLRIDVAPKSKVRIRNIEFAGNEKISDQKLKHKMKKTHEHARISLHRALLRAIFTRPAQMVAKTHESNWQQVKEFITDNVKPNIFNTSKFIQSDYDADKEKLISYFNTKGYRDATIVSDTVIRRDSRTIDIRFTVEEGPKYYFRNIIWKGNFVYTDRALNEVLAITKGDVYNKELIERRLSFNPKGPDISGLYLDNGYLFFRINPVEIVVPGDSIDVEMRITEGDQATIDEVTFTGNDRTNDHVIRRELSTLPGQKFRRVDIIRTQQKLASLGYFDPQQISQDLIPDPENSTVDINWKLVEQSNDNIQLSGGWGGYYGFVGTLGLTFNNFSVRNIPHPDRWRYLPVGDGQRLSMSAQANGKNFQNYTISFTEPWLGGRKPQSLTVSASKAISRYPGIGATSYTDLNSHLKVDNLSVGLGKYLEWPDDFFTLTNSLSYAVYSLKNYNIGIGCDSCRFYSFTLTTALARNSIDDYNYPTSGSSVSLSATFTPPYSVWRKIDYEAAAAGEINKWVEYHKWMFDSKFYMPLDNNKNLVLEAKAHFGFIGNYTNKVGTSPFERFYLGGSGLAGGFNSYVLAAEVIGLRGYDDNQITPPFYTGGETNVIRGGIVYDKFGLELRYPVTKGATTVYGFIFTEAGNNWYNYEDFNPFRMYKSAGFGVRLNMPAFGLIGLNWAYGFDSFPLDSNGAPSGSQFHFTIGQQIR